MPIGTDTEGAVHAAVGTDAAVHDGHVMEKLLPGKERIVYGDQAYASQSRKEELEQAGKTCRINRKGGAGRKLTAADKAFNRKSNRVRARIEHVFGVVKNLWGDRKARYQGLAKNRAQVLALLALANFYRFRDQLV